MRYEDITLESAIESYPFGIDYVCDGDQKEIKFNMECFHCGKSFELSKIGLYCDECKLKGERVKSI